MRPNKLLVTMLLAILTCLSSVGSAKAGFEDAAGLLYKSDIIRNPQESFVVDVHIVEYTNKKIADQTNVVVNSRKNTDKQFLSIVHINSPASDRGKLLLRNGNNLWMFDPKSKASVRISPRQRLVGNASNGDVVTSNLTVDYSAELAGEENIEDGDKNSCLAWKLKLKASNSFAPYSSVEFWVDKENSRPLKGKFYGPSGKLLKVAWYRGWKKVLGQTRPTEVVIADGFNNNKVTIMTMSNYRIREMPLSWFNKEWLPNFSVESN